MEKTVDERSETTTSEMIVEVKQDYICRRLLCRGCLKYKLIKVKDNLKPTERLPMLCSDCLKSIPL